MRRGVRRCPGTRGSSRKMDRPLVAHAGLVGCERAEGGRGEVAADGKEKGGGEVEYGVAE